jgi:general L-amino acid transport system substrate-binding protein
MINAEELDVTMDNVDDMVANSENARILRMLGVEGEYGQEVLGLDIDFAYNVIKKIGNFDELVERFYSINDETRVGGFYRPRGNDALWNEGGLLFAPGLE